MLIFARYLSVTIYNQTWIGGGGCNTCAKYSLGKCSQYSRVSNISMSERSTFHKLHTRIFTYTCILVFL